MCAATTADVIEGGDHRAKKGGVAGDKQTPPGSGEGKVYVWPTALCCIYNAIQAANTLLSQWDEYCILFSNTLDHQADYSSISLA